MIKEPYADLSNETFPQDSYPMLVKNINGEFIQSVYDFPISSYDGEHEEEVLEWENKYRKLFRCDRFADKV